MKPVAKMSDLVTSLEMQNDEYRSYFDRQTGEIVIVERSILSAVEEGDDEGLEDEVPAWQKSEVEVARTIIADGSDRFIRPPDRFEFHEYQHMERFIETIPIAEIANQLWRAIRGSGAFGRFKSTLYRLGIENRWYRYRDEAMKEFVIEWAKENDVAYEDDYRPVYKK